MKRIFLVVFSLAIMLIYLGCECFYDLDSVSDYVYPALVNGLTILSVYLAWRSYTKENISVLVSILLLGIAVMLPFAEGVDGWFNWDWAERVLTFIWLLWPVLITGLNNYFIHKLSKNKKCICGANILFVFLLAVVFHCLVEGTGGGKEKIDLCISLLWLAEGILWTFALNFTNQKRHRKRNLMVAWMMCLLLFGCFTFIETSYLPSTAIWNNVRGNYWNKAIFLCLPVLLLSVMRMTEIYIPEDKPYFVQKRSLLYFLTVLLLTYFITNNGLNLPGASLKYDFARGFYLLFLAVIIFWKEIYRKQEQKGSRLKGAAFMAAVNIGVFFFFLIRCRRLQEILFYVRDFFSGSSLTVSQVDWVGYRKAAFEAFLSKNLTELDNVYGKESYINSLHGHGLVSIRFQYGMLPLLLMLLLLVLVVIILWNWNQKDKFLNQCARYLAIGYILKMSVAFILQASFIISPYMEFPFSGRDIAEILLPLLLVYETYRQPIWSGEGE